MASFFRGPTSLGCCGTSCRAAGGSGTSSTERRSDSPRPSGIPGCTRRSCIGCLSRTGRFRYTPHKSCSPRRRKGSRRRSRGPRGTRRRRCRPASSAGILCQRSRCRPCTAARKCYRSCGRAPPGAADTVSVSEASDALHAVRGADAAGRARRGGPARNTNVVAGTAVGAPARVVDAIAVGLALHALPVYVADRSGRAAVRRVTRDALAVRPAVLARRAVAISRTSDAHAVEASLGAGHVGAVVGAAALDAQLVGSLARRYGGTVGGTTVVCRAVGVSLGRSISTTLHADRTHAHLQVCLCGIIGVDRTLSCARALDA